ncbi:MAG: saccharopine dehydrogenase L-lysine forming [Pseudonocardiales bacterium]|nr:saccharopine dehydrogenase L-lysine forming [Pseudonocardiales bacterium]
MAAAVTAALTLWLRAESRADERRTPLVPGDVAKLVAAGIEVVVEKSAHRVFADAEFAAAGARLAGTGSWPDAPDSAVVLGLKELPAEPYELRHRHAFFGHAYKNQPGARLLLDRFVGGGGALLDLEYLTDDTGRRLAAFGYWAGYVGAALAVLQHAGVLDPPLRPGTREELDRRLAEVAAGRPRVLVLGALGRSGTGARDALEAAGLPATGWDVAETRQLDRAAMLDHDVLVNTVLTTQPARPYLTVEDLAQPHRLGVLCDVTNDVGSPYNLFPLYTETTSWQEPVLQVSGTDLALIAIDNLPSLLPREASISFSAELVEPVAGLRTGSAPWRRCLALFHEHATGDD